MAYLIITNGLDQGQLFELSEGPNVLGRDGEADIQIALSACEPTTCLSACPR